MELCSSCAWSYMQMRTAGKQKSDQLQAGAVHISHDQTDVARSMHATTRTGTWCILRYLERCPERPVMQLNPAAAY